jgi:predicted choloylglycine hydrolase
VYSSGINSQGLALADTAVGTADHGVGLLRYFLMTRLLAGASTVDEALVLIGATAHAGGGTLVLADAGGALASVELGHRASAVQRSDRGFVARTNHFLGTDTSPHWRASAGDPMAASSTQRLAAVRAALQSADALGVDEAFAIMSRHDGAEGVGLCRHGQDGDALTISCAVFALAPPTLYFCAGAPCGGARLRITA